MVCLASRPRDEVCSAMSDAKARQTDDAPLLIGLLDLLPCVAHLASPEVEVVFNLVSGEAHSRKQGESYREHWEHRTSVRILLRWRRNLYFY